MAQLKDTIVTGDLSVTGTIYGDVPLNDLTDADDLKAIEALTGTSGILTKTAANTWSLSSGAAPTSHAHGNITNAGAIGTAANKGVYTGTNGVLTAGTIPIAAGGTGLTASPSMLTNLGSTTAANVLQASPRPGVTGTLGVAHGGTGATTFTSGALLIGNGTNAVGTRTIKNMTAAGNLGWTAAGTDIYIPTVNTLAYWNGRYNDSSSNLAYCNKGAFGNAVTYGVDDATANGALGTGTGLTTERSVYYGLVTVNNASQTRATGIYAPTSAGTAGYILKSSGGTAAPTWLQTLPIANGGTGNTTGTATLAITAADTTNELVALGVASDATTALKRDTNLLIKSNSIYPATTDTGSIGTTDKHFESGYFGKSVDVDTTGLADLTEARFTVTGPNGSVSLSTYNTRGLWDDTNRKWMIYSYKEDIEGGNGLIVRIGQNACFNSATYFQQPYTGATIENNTYRHNTVVDSLGWTYEHWLGRIEHALLKDKTSEYVIRTWEPGIGSSSSDTHQPAGLWIIRKPGQDGYCTVQCSSNQAGIIRNIHIGTATPGSSYGKEGEVYLKY